MITSASSEREVSLFSLENNLHILAMVMHLLMVPAFVSLTASLCLIVQHDHMYYSIQYLGGHNSGEEDISFRKRGGLIFRIFVFIFRS